ncbi:hypothetical protein F383_02508 [Gossypium arboreum]|uniref:Uncharacterized protein n=1 Tax=Gossypium arboreum TaxID=29729 RepID=A0A0B0PKV9_GOSAR|nr:hypothetical protein F383_02508 [Gossypium arboreum]
MEFFPPRKSKNRFLCPMQPLYAPLRWLFADVVSEDVAYKLIFFSTKWA